MIVHAIEKLRTEMEQNAGNAYIQVVGQFLIEHVTNNPSSAERILADRKSVV